MEREQKGEERKKKVRNMEGKKEERKEGRMDGKKETENKEASSCYGRLPINLGEPIRV